MNSTLTNTKVGSILEPAIETAAVDTAIPKLQHLHFKPNY